MSIPLDHEAIGSLYDVVAEEDVLGALSTVVRRVLDVDSAGLWLNRGGDIVAISVTPDIVESTPSYLAYYQSLDPWAGAGPGAVNAVRTGDEIAPEADLLASEFYNDFARHFGIRRPMGVTMDLGPGLVLTLSTNRAACRGLLEARDKPRLQALVPHVRRALAVRERLGIGFAGRPDAGGAAAALDAIGHGLVVCDGHCRVLHANAAARALAACGTPLLRGQPARLGAPVRCEEEALVRLVFEAGGGRGGGGTRLTGPEGRRISALVAPLPPAIGAGFDSSLDPGKVLVALREEDAVASPSAAALRSLYGLSPAQADLCRAVAAGRTFEDIADERGVAVTTLRTHLAAVLVRTGARNLRDLVRLLGTLPPLR